jgi:hypothetical protein
MRAPGDPDPDASAPAETQRRAGRQPSAQGGKALNRLRQMELERGLPITDLTDPAPRAAPAGARYLDAFNQLARLPRAAPPTPVAAPAPPAGAAAAPPPGGRQPALQVAQGWRPLGPFLIPHGQSYGDGPGSRPSVSGRISAVAVHPENPDVILVGAAGGGVWRTSDNGRTWSPRTDDQPSLATGAIAFTPGHPDVVYAGTGEGDNFYWFGVGLLKSNDAGVTWSMVATAPFVGAGFHDIDVDPTNADHTDADRLLAATTAGLFLSIDGGEVWELLVGRLTWCLSRHPTRGAEVFAATASGLVHSIDGGTSWTQVDLPDGAASYVRMAVAHAPSDGGVVWVSAVDADGVHIWRRSTDSGPFSTIRTDGAEIRTSQAFYDWFLAVAPDDPDVVYLGEIHLLKGTREGVTVHLENISSRTVGDSIHPDQHCIAFGPASPDDIVVGNDGGVYRSPDGGTTWTSLNRGLNIAEFGFIAQQPGTGAFLLGGTQDNGTERHEGHGVWYHLDDGDGGDCGVDETSPSTCYHSYYRLGLQRSTAGGAWGSWTELPLPAGDSRLFYPPMEVRGRVVVQAGFEVFISSDGGDSWSTVALPGDYAAALASASDVRIYVAAACGRLYQIDKSDRWRLTRLLAAPRTAFISDLLVDPTNPDRLWATCSNLGPGAHVFRSDNAGVKWNDASAGLPVIPVNAIEIDPAHPDTVWVAADVGVYRSDNAGTSWTAFDNLLPNALAKDLAFDAGRRLLRCATRSRGVWEIAVDSPTMPDVEVYLRDTAVDTADIKVDAPPFQTEADIDFEVFNDDHGVFAAGLVHRDARPGEAARVFVQVHNRGPSPAADVDVKVFFADASGGVPDLPADFWALYPDSDLPSGAWSQVAAKQRVATVVTGAPQIVRFDWSVPATAAADTCLLAVITAANDALTTSELDVERLVGDDRRCGLRHVRVSD